MPTRFGRQPAYDELARRGLHVSDAALALGIKHVTLYRIVSGHGYPQRDVCEALATLLERPVPALFTEEALDARPKKTGPKPKVIG